MAKKYKVGEIYGGRKYLGMTPKKSYILECIDCKNVIYGNMKQSINSTCLCKLESTKYKIGDTINGRIVVGRHRPAGLLMECPDCNRISMIQYINIPNVVCICKRNYLGTTYGKLNYDGAGHPICEICGVSYKKLGGHIRQKHGMLAKEYKEKFGLDRKQSLMCEESIELARKRNAENRELVVDENLINKGTNTRFRDGDKGRTREQLREQTKIRLKKLHTYNRNHI